MDWEVGIDLRLQSNRAASVFGSPYPSVNEGVLLFEKFVTEEHHLDTTNNLQQQINDIRSELAAHAENVSNLTVEHARGLR